MDFFEYATIALQFVNSKTLYVPLIVGALCFLTVFVFQAIGLYTIAAREGLKNKWMAFVPFLNTYYIGVCGQKNRAFASVNTKTLSLAASILEAWSGTSFTTLPFLNCLTQVACSRRCRKVITVLLPSCSWLACRWNLLGRLGVSSAFTTIF